VPSKNGSCPPTPPNAQPRKSASPSLSASQPEIEIECFGTSDGLSDLSDIESAPETSAKKPIPVSRRNRSGKVKPRRKGRARAKLRVIDSQDIPCSQQSKEAHQEPDVEDDIEDYDDIIPRDKFVVPAIAEDKSGTKGRNAFDTENDDDIIELWPSGKSSSTDLQRSKAAPTHKRPEARSTVKFIGSEEIDSTAADSAPPRDVVASSRVSDGKAKGGLRTSSPPKSTKSNAKVHKTSPGVKSGQETIQIKPRPRPTRASAANASKKIAQHAKLLNETPTQASPGKNKELSPTPGERPPETMTGMPPGKHVLDRC
jgi:hypothetical protein